MNSRREFFKKTGAVMAGVALAPLISAPLAAIAKPKILLYNRYHGLRAGDTFTIFDQHIGKIGKVRDDFTIEFEYVDVCENLKQIIDDVVDDYSEIEVQSVVLSMGDIYEAAGNKA